MQRDVKVLIGLLGVVVVGGVAGKLWIDRSVEGVSAAQERQAAKDAEDYARLKRITAKLEAPSPPPAPETPQDKRLRAVYAAWETFDQLPDRLRNKRMLLVCFNRAREMTENLPPEDASELDYANLVELRRRVPLFMVAGEPGFASGEGLMVLVPSSDQPRCAELAKLWSENDETYDELQSYGFERISCGSVNFSLQY